MIRVVNVGRNANNATNASTFYVNSNNDSSNRNRNIGRHRAVVSSVKPTPARLGEYVYPIQVGSKCEHLGEHQQ
jgi:hypothetical protein